jgi:hypothetical protein
MSKLLKRVRGSGARTRVQFGGGLVLLLAFAIVASGTSEAAGRHALGPVVATKSYVTPPANSEWLAWNRAKCAFTRATKHPSSYKAVLRKLSSPITVDLGAADTSVQVYQTIDASYAKYAKLANIKFHVFDNQFPSDSAALNVAREMTVTKPTVAIEDQEVAALYPRIQPIFQQGCTPMVDEFNIGTPKPSPGFQAGYVASGAALGKGMIQLVHQRHWTARDTWVVLCGDPLIANKQGTDLTVNTTFVHYMTQYLHIPASNISPELNCNNNVDTAHTVTLDFLTAHPQAKYVIAESFSDFITVPMVQALQQKGYTLKTALAAGGQGNEAPLQAMAKGSLLQDEYSKDFQHWGILGLAMAEDIAAGRPVPELADPGVTPIVGSKQAAEMLKTEKLPL